MYAILANDLAQCAAAAYAGGRAILSTRTVMAKTMPEAAYFLAEVGKRSGIIFFDLKERADVPRIAETLIKDANASLELSNNEEGPELRFLVMGA